MKHRFLFCLAAAACGLALTACAETGAEASSVLPAASPQQAEPPAQQPAIRTAETATAETAGLADALLLDFTAGSEVEDVRVVQVPGGVDAAALCAALTEETGIAFDFTLEQQGDAWTVTWQAGSALWDGEMPQGGSPDYVFYDADLLRWFLLDTVWRTLNDSFGAQAVYYRAADGQPPALDDLWPLEHFDLAGPYRGSAWYYGESIAYKDEWEVLDQTGEQ